MSKQFLAFLILGILAVTVLVAGLLVWSRGSHLELKGQILKVRTLSLEENSSLAVLDFRFSNPSDLRFVVRQVDVSLVDGKGNVLPGAVVSEMDAQRIFQYYPLLGQKYNPTLVMREKIASRETKDRMVAVRFEVPEAQLKARKRLLIRVEDVDGMVSEITEGGR